MAHTVASGAKAVGYDFRVEAGLVEAGRASYLTRRQGAPMRRPALLQNHPHG